ncbi:MAG: Hpt domain-containing protein [Bacilli bacterium]|jgi:HPt (histidine-containing phosphotransfer) domain-containing protein|nr:Hpt domain-containing protein [Bacilli bacterium]
MGNEALYVKFLKKFPMDASFPLIKPAFDKGDLEAAFEAAHTVKGVSGNLGLTRLYKATSNTVALLRAQEKDKAVESYQEIADSYAEAVKTIEKYL